MELSNRQQKILAAVVEHYIAAGEPVGSKMLCDSLDFTVSPATVRNEMSELAERGLLLQPHTSAGRIPSQKGYRVYVDRLMKSRPLSPEERRTIDSLLLSNAYDPQKLLEGVSRLLAGMTRFAAVSTSPGGQGAAIRAVQFVQTSRRTAMAILITSAGTMKTRVFRCDYDEQGFFWRFVSQSGTLTNENREAVATLSGNLRLTHRDGSSVSAHVEKSLSPATSRNAGDVRYLVDKSAGMPLASCSASQRDTTLRISFSARFIVYR